MSTKVIVKDTTARDITIAVIAGALVLAFVFFAFSSMSKKVAGHGLTGTIVAKHFTPQREEQITIGSGGVHERQLDGTYTFEVHVAPEPKNYTVWVDKPTYETHQVGDQFYFLLPVTSPAAP